MGKFDSERMKAIAEAKKKVKESVNPDFMIINAINSIEELDKSINSIASRLREWYALSNPEIENAVEDNEQIIAIVVQGKGGKSVMGAEFSDSDEKALQALALAGNGLIQSKTFLLLYLEQVMKPYCRNVLALAGPTIGARLIREARSLKKLASLQSSTVQLLGAETALFRHIKTGAKSPKYGHIVNHPVVASAKKEDRGKAARALADKISIAARLDFFKGEFLGNQMLEDLKKKFAK